MSKLLEAAPQNTVYEPRVVRIYTYPAGLPSTLTFAVTQAKSPNRSTFSNTKSVRFDFFLKIATSRTALTAIEKK